MFETMDLTQKKNVKQIFSDRSETYSDEYYLNSVTAYSFRIRQKRVIEYLDNLNGKKILDIGCGPGIMVDYMIEKNFEYHGVDISEKMIDVCNKKYSNIESVKFSIGAIEAIKYPDNFFDIVIVMGVVEYVDKDLNAIKELARVVKPQGTVIITLPNKYSPFRIWHRIIYSRLADIKNKIFLKNNIKEKIIHREYSEKSYCDLLEQNSLSVNDVVYYNLNIILSPFEKIFPVLAVTITKKVELLYKSIFRLIGTGFIVRCKKL